MEKENILLQSGSIPCYTCSECENDMIIQSYVRSPFIGILLECSSCGREIELEGKHKEVLL